MTMRVLGINSGTSMDGLDFAVVTVSDAARSRRSGPPLDITCECHATAPYRAALRKRLRAVAQSTSVEKVELARLHMSLGGHTARAAGAFLADAGFSPGDIDLVGMHGQTVGHWPDARKVAGFATRASLQIGDPTPVAVALGVPVVADFRTADLAVGGQGAPLSGWYHHLMFGPGVPVLNIGGIANVSASRKRGGQIEVLAFDTGPGNCLIDHVARTRFGRSCDRGGRLARRGSLDMDFVCFMVRSDYFRRFPPKTTDPAAFGEPFLEEHVFEAGRVGIEPHDLIACVTELTALSIMVAFEKWVETFADSKELIVSGGGTQNATLMAGFERSSETVRILSPEKFGFPPKHIEAIGFAVLAAETWQGRPGNRGGATKARHELPLGRITLP